MHQISLDDRELNPIAAVDRVSFGNIFSWAHAVLGARWGILALAALVLTVYNFAAQIITSLVDTALFGQTIVAFFSPLTVIHSVLVVAPLGVGPIYIAARTFRGEYAGFDDIFIGFHRWGSVVLVSLLIQLAVFILSTGFGVVAASVGLTSGAAGSVLLMIGVAGIIFAIVMLYLSVRIYFATLLIVDPIGPHSSALESLQISWHLTSRSAWTLFWTAIVISVIAGVCFLLLILPGILYGMPLIYAASGAVYVILTHEHGIIPLAGYDHCPYCQYDLTDTEGDICPECGNTVPRKTPAESTTAPYHPIHNRYDQTPPPDEPPIPLS